MSDFYEPAYQRTPYWIATIAECDGLEIQPYLMADDPETGRDRVFFEKCAPEDAQMWLVLGRCQNGEETAYLDHFSKRDEARAFALHLLEKWPHLKANSRID